MTEQTYSYYTVYLTVAIANLRFCKIAHAWHNLTVQLFCTEEIAKQFARENNAIRLRKGEHDIDLMQTGFTHCNNCNGKGIYYFGTCINGVMSCSGPCFQCQSKGYQTIEDRKRNWGYNQHRKVF